MAGNMTRSSHLRPLPKMPTLPSSKYRHTLLRGTDRGGLANRLNFNNQRHHSNHYRHVMHSLCGTWGHRWVMGRARSTNILTRLSLLSYYHSFGKRACSNSERSACGACSSVSGAASALA